MNQFEEVNAMPVRVPLLSLKLAVAVFFLSLVSGSSVIFGRQELSLAELTPVQQAQLQLEYLELPDGRLFCELRAGLSYKNEVSIVFSDTTDLNSSPLSATIRVRPYRDSAAANNPIVVRFIRDSTGVYIADLASARRDINTLAARHPAETGAASLPCGPYSFCESPNLFVPKALSAEPNVWIMNRSTAQAGWSVNLFSRPCGVASYVYIDPLRSYNYIAVTDPNWDRFVAAEDTIAGLEGQGILAFGQTGSGTGQLRSPRGACAFGSYLYVADCYNNRVIKYWARNSTFETIATYPGFNKPTDVDLHVGNYLVVANTGDNSVEIENIMSVTSVSSDPSCEGSPSTFSYPVSVAVGRNPSTGKTNEFVYVADAGNRRLVRFSVFLNSFGSYEAGIWTCHGFDPSQNVELTSVDVDYLGYVYATDALNGKIYKFDRNLIPIACYGALGQSGSQLYYPEGIDFVQGSKWVNNVGTVELKSLGDVLVTERYSDQTGVRRYYGGTDVLSLSGQWLNAADAYEFQYDVPSPSIVKAEVYRQVLGNWLLRRTLFTGQAYAHGLQSHHFSTSADVNGTYMVRVTAKSIYGVQQSVAEVLYSVVHVQLDSRPRITSISFDKFVRTCLVGDGIYDSIRVTAEDPEGDFISSYEFKLIYPNTGAGAWDPLAYFPIRLQAGDFATVVTPYNRTRVNLFTTNPPPTPTSELGPREMLDGGAGGSDARTVTSVTAATEATHIEVRCFANGKWSEPYSSPVLVVLADTCNCANRAPVAERVQFDEFRYYCAATGEKDTVRIWAHDPDGQPLYVHLRVASAGGAKFSFANDTKFSLDTTVTDTAIAFIAGTYATTGLDVVTVTVDDRLTCTPIPEFVFQIPVLQDRSACNDAPSFASPLGLRGAPMSCIVNGTLWLAGGAASDPEQDTLMCRWTSVHGHFEFPGGQTTEDTTVRQADSLWYRAQCPTDAGGNPVQGTETVTLTVTDPLGGTATSLRSFTIFPSASNCPGSDPGCPYLYVWDGSKWDFENSILASSEGQTDRRDTLYDYYLLSPIVSDGGREVRIRIAEQENEISYLDEVSLYAVDAPIDSRISIDNDGNVYSLVEPLYPTSIVDHLGAERKADLLDVDDGKFQSLGPGYLILTYDPSSNGVNLSYDSITDGRSYTPSVSTDGPPGGEIPPPGKEDTPAKVAVVTTAGPQDTASAALHVEIATSRGIWTRVDDIFPRVGGGTRYVDFSPWVPSSDLPFQVKYSWEKHYSADALRLFRYQRVDSSRVTLLRPHASYHSQAGDVTERLSRTDGERVTLVPGEDIEFTYSAPAQPTGRSTRRYLLSAKGYYVSQDSQPSARAVAVLPTQFALDQNYPNPFNPSTSIAFSLPSQNHARLDVFNLLGRHVVTLLDREHDAGTYSVSWNGTDKNGEEVGSGVYLYRLSSGSVSATRKMLLMK